MDSIVSPHTLAYICCRPEEAIHNVSEEVVEVTFSPNVDFSIFKNFQATKRINFKFRAESYNLLNQVVFGSPNQVLSSGQFGVISTQANELMA